MKRLITLSVVVAAMCAVAGCKKDPVAKAERAIETAKQGVALHNQGLASGQADVRTAIADVDKHQRQLDQAEVTLSAAYEEYELRVRERLELINVHILAMPATVDVAKLAQVKQHYEQLFTAVNGISTITVAKWEPFKTHTSAAFADLERMVAALDGK